MSTQTPLCFFQLPSSLPIRAGAGRPLHERHVDAPDYLAALAGFVPGTATAQGGAPGGGGPGAGASGASGTAGGGKDGPAPLNELEGGQLGELLVRRSGKVTLSVGGMMLDVTPGTTCSIEQEIVVMGIPERPGEHVDLHQIGKLHERMVVTPDLEHFWQPNQA